MRRNEMAIDTRIRHRTRPDANVFEDVGFPPKPANSCFPGAMKRHDLLRFLERRAGRVVVPVAELAVLAKLAKAPPHKSR